MSDWDLWSADGRYTLAEAIDGLYAYESGCVDSGIHDELLRKSVDDYIRSLSAKERMQVLSRIMRESCLSEEAIEVGYGWEDAWKLGEWFSDQGWVGWVD